MAHITLPAGLPGIRGPMAFRPETAKPLNEIVDVFCLCNRYVDGLATWTPDDPGFYRQRAALIAEHGYAASTLAAAGVPPK